MQKIKAPNHLLFAACVLLAGCANQQPNKFSDPDLVAIADLQDHRAADSLLVYLHSSNPLYRRAAALACASIQDTTASSALGNALLEDPDAEVRANAAFALGQTGGFAATNALLPAATDQSADVRHEVLEALGKVLKTSTDLDVLKNYEAHDTLTTTGLAWAFYRLGVRGIADSAIVAKCASLLDRKNIRMIRLAAAQFFSRSRIDASNFAVELIAAATGDDDANVRMAAANALGKISKSKAEEAIASILKTERDARVKVNAIRAAARIESIDLLLTGLTDASMMVRTAASEGIVSQKTLDKSKLMEALAANEDMRVKANLLAALFKTPAADSVFMKWQIIFEKEADEYSRAHLLNALSTTSRKLAGEAIDQLARQLLSSKEYVIKSSSAQALVSLDRSNSFQKQEKEKLAKIYATAIEDGDRAVIATVCGALTDEKLGYRKFITDYSFLTRARNQLRLPEDYEAIEPLEAALAWFEGKKAPAKPENKFNHPIDWMLAKQIPRDQRVMIKTSKGDILLQLLVEEAPGSVVNFYQLTKRGYFNGKYFHRVVPNFVIQTGCNRGDGFGGEDYSIRSEFSRRRYTTGSVGMASAGKDTEGTQWFITHSPTPHLDGGYTIFAVTVGGQPVADAIGVGDKILSVTLLEGKY